MTEQTRDTIEESHEQETGNAGIYYTPRSEKQPVLARIISTVLHPLFMVVYTVALIYLYTDFRFLFADQFVRFMIPVLFLSCVAPLCGIYFLMFAKVINSYELSSNDNRFLSFFVFFVSYCLLFYYFFAAKLYIWFLAVLLVPILLLVIYAITSMFWKISAHMMGIGGLIGSILSMCYYVKGLNLYILFIILFILAGSLGVSRLMMNRNTPGQVYAGFLTGLTVSFFTVWLGAYWGLIVFIRNYNL